MVKKVIQVPVDEKLLEDLNEASRKRGRPRSEFIREACVRYLRQSEYERMDETYREGYKRQPEEASIGQVQAALADRVLPEEPW